MALTKQKFTSYLKAADFRTLFIEEMGWNKVSAAYSTLPTFFVGDTPFDIKAIAHRNGFQVLQCIVRELPSNSSCKKLDSKLRKAANDYICIFIVNGTEHHQWVAPVRLNEKRDLVIIEYAEAEKAQFLYEKISGLSFEIDESTTIVDVKERVQSAFAINSEKITKDFYTGFSKEHKTFAEFITGIDDRVAAKDNKNKQWYTSVMLNRLMFCYFIQKKGFLDGDENYLRNKLCWVKENKGNDKFFKSFYKGFLVHLFRDGLNSPIHENAFESVYGRIPYLNGGMFDIHQIEKDYANIDIKDEAFESLFAFFDKWRWHLDTRVTASGRDINPDVLGYIFEQYINDRAQMGAYYTKEDITEYIGRNTIIPYLFEAVRKAYPAAFAPNARFWCFLRDAGQDFIYDAFKKGVHEDIPDEIAEGIDTEAPNLLSRRRMWNNLTPDNIGLPSEIWRETMQRFQRYNEITDKLHRGDFESFNDFVTYNLNTPKIAYDFLSTTADKKFIKVFYDELRKVTILDPTCGSGAFLFAALNLLEPLYEVCISRMEEYNVLDSSEFKDELSEIKNKYRSNIQYFIYKSIILRNLYGVDIMAEAVEIAKLRLFLKMVAVVEVDRKADNMGLDPLPDVDFNIRCGNTLIGYTSENELYRDLDTASDLLQQLANQELKERLEKQLKDVADTYEVFRLEQLSRDADVKMLKDAKLSLNKELFVLNDLLNKHLYASTSQIDYHKWLELHQPFHWLAEFYQIMHNNGGFDVIIGNPPYVEYSKRNVQYSITGYETLKSSNLYAFVFERSFSLTSKKVAFIVQMSAVGTESMRTLQEYLLNNTSVLHFGCFPERPKQLFDGACIALSIIMCERAANNQQKVFGSGVSRTTDEGRSSLFSSLSFIPIPRSSFLSGYYLFPKFKYSVELDIVKKLFKDKPIIRYTTSAVSKNSISYRTAGGRYWKIVLNRPFATESTSNKTKYITSEMPSSALVAILNSNLLWWYYVNYYDLYNFKDYMIFNFCYSIKEDIVELSKLGKQLMASFEAHKVVNTQYIKSKQKESVFESFNPQLSKDIVDQIDTVLARHYQFSEKELDFIINYDIKYRMGENTSDTE